MEAGTQSLGIVPYVQPADLPRLRERRRPWSRWPRPTLARACCSWRWSARTPSSGLEDGERPPRGVQPGLDRDKWWRRHPDDAALSFTRLTLLRASLDEMAAFRETHTTFLETDAIPVRANLRVAGSCRLTRRSPVRSRRSLAWCRRSRCAPTSGSGWRIRRSRSGSTIACSSAFPISRGAARSSEDARIPRPARRRDRDCHRMLALGTWYLGEAHYWKAWNLFSLGRLDDSKALSTMRVG